MPTSTAGKPAHALIPYTKGTELRFRRHVPPLPFGGNYGPSPRAEVQLSRDDEVLDRVTFALSHPPLVTEPLGADERTFTITGNKTLRRLGIDDGGAHIVTGHVDGNTSVTYLAKIYDGVYYPLRCRETGTDCMTLADCDYATEAWAYETMQPVPTVGARLIPKYFGAWTFPLETGHRGRARWVRMLILELVDGESMLDKILRATKNGAVQYSLLPPEAFRLRVLRDVMDAKMAIWWDAEVLHRDEGPRNVLIRNDGSVVIIDFNQDIIYRFIQSGPPHAKDLDDTPRLPPSPIENFWPFIPMGSPWIEWLPESWLKDDDLAAEWLLETWGNASPDRYQPLSDYFLSDSGHSTRSKKVQGMLKKLGWKPPTKQ